MRIAVTVGLLCALGSPASAQPHTPGFATIDRFDDQVKAEVAASWVRYDARYASDLDLETFRFDLFGQYISDGGYGGYAMLGVSYGSMHGDVLGEQVDDSGFGANNIEVGALYALRGSAFDTILRGGLTLPTATRADAGEVDPNQLASWSRPTDFIQHAADTSVLRVSASPIIHHDNAFFRIDAGLDVPIDDGATADSEGLHTMVRVNLGAGVETGGIALTGEIVNLATTDDQLDPNQDRFLHWVGGGARYLGSGPFQPSLALQVPLDDDIDKMIDFVLIFGVQYVAPSDGDATP